MYNKPVILTNEDMAEGVFAAGSNTATCWSGTIKSVQDYLNGYNIFELNLVHNNSVQHVYHGVTVKVSFNANVTSALPHDNDGAVTWSGNTVTATRSGFGDGYNSGDNVSFKIQVSAGDEALTKALVGNIISFYCDSDINVQGGGANGT